jgi:hypothetical protein
MLAVNQYEKLNWGDELYRVGVIADGSCFFHALLLTSDPNYVTATSAEKVKIARAFRRRLADELKLIDFLEASSNGTPLYKDLPEAVKKYHQAVYTLPPATRRRLELELNKLYYHPTLLDYTQEQLATFLRQFLAFREYIADPQAWVGDELHLLVSRVLDIDIYITKEEDEGVGYIYNDPELAYKGREGVILYHVGGNHWEAVGKMTPEGVSTSFPSDDSFILRLRKYNADCWEKLQR